MILGLKYGKTPARVGGISFRLESFLNSTVLPPLPARFGHDNLVSSWGMLANDKYGDCVWAGAAHETIILTSLGNHAAQFHDENVLSDYSACTGFIPGDQNTDKGTDMQKAASYRRNVGIVDGTGKRHQIAAYMALEPGNIEHLYYASYLFGAVGIGLRMPWFAQYQFEYGLRWDIISESDAEIDGGHYVPLVGRGPEGLRVVSWGREQLMTERFLKAFCDEAIAYVSQEALVNQKSPEGFDYEKLTSMLATLAAPSPGQS